jgi:MFS family permease
MLAVVALFTILMGAIDLLAVLVAVEALGADEASSGWLVAAFALGGAVSGPLTMALVGRHSLGIWVTGSGVTAGCLVALLGVTNSAVGVFATIIAAGTAAAINQLAGLMLLQRVTHLDLLGHVFGLLGSLTMAMLAIGTQLVPAGTALFGDDGAAAAIGVLVAGVTLLLARAIWEVDRNAQVPVVEMAMLRRGPIFAGLPGAALETLAREAELHIVPAGQTVIREGEPGTAYYVIVRGVLDLTVRSITEVDRREGRI